PRRGRAGAFAKAAGRFLFAAVTNYLCLLAVAFFIGRVVPIDPVLALLGDLAPNHVVERVRQAMGFNLPLYQPFFIYIKG
ncbi:ABC transporter permease, partial [Rhizobium ruizarguesonis]